MLGLQSIKLYTVSFKSGFIISHHSEKTAFLSRSSQLNLKHNALIVIKEQRKFRQIRNNFIYLPKIRAIKIQNLFNQLAGYFLLPGISYEANQGLGYFFDRNPTFSRF